MDDMQGVNIPESRDEVLGKFEEARAFQRGNSYTSLEFQSYILGSLILVLKSDAVAVIQLLE